jgi:lipopolysaccharide transport system permease protein
VLGHIPGPALLWLPLLTAITVALALGLGLALGVLNVFMRDIGQVVPVALQFLYWFTPIVYMVNIIPAQYRGWLALNPLIPIIGGYQDVLLYGRAPDAAGLVRSCLVAAVMLVMALVLFRKASPEMVDQL